MFNLMKTAILMAAITALFMLLGRMLGGQSGMLLALVVALGMNFFSYWFSDKIVLKMYKAREVDDSTAPQFVAMVRELAGKAGIPMPKVYLIDHLPSDPRAAELLWIAAVSLALSLLATLYPSWRAARLKPAEALRHE